jgi:hypothetical protein
MIEKGNGVDEEPESHGELNMLNIVHGRPFWLGQV